MADDYGFAGMAGDASSNKPQISVRLSHSFKYKANICQVLMMKQTGGGLPSRERMLAAEKIADRQRELSW